MTSKPDHEERLGCSDGGCALEKPTGMHTNSGKCYCIEGLGVAERRKVRAYVKKMRQRVAELEAENNRLCSRSYVEACKYEAAVKFVRELIDIYKVTPKHEPFALLVGISEKAEAVMKLLCVEPDESIDNG